jgi:hypothetical protein
MQSLLLDLGKSAGQSAAGQKVGNVFGYYTGTPILDESIAVHKGRRRQF